MIKHCIPNPGVYEDPTGCHPGALPAGVAGPNAMDFDVRCFLVPHATGVTIVDTGMDPSVSVIAEKLAEIGSGARLARRSVVHVPSRVRSLMPRRSRAGDGYPDF